MVEFSVGFLVHTSFLGKYCLKPNAIVGIGGIRDKKLSILNWLILKTDFEFRWIGNNGPFHWAPDLTSMNFYFCVQMKAMFQKEALTNMQDLKAAIRQAFEQISPKIVTLHFGLLKKVDLSCLLTESMHFEQLLCLQRRKCIKKLCGIKLGNFLIWLSKFLTIETSFLRNTRILKQGVAFHLSCTVVYGSMGKRSLLENGHCREVVVVSIASSL